MPGFPGPYAPLPRGGPVRLGRMLLATLLLGGALGAGGALLHQEGWRRALPGSVPEAVGKARQAVLQLLPPARGR